MRTLCFSRDDGGWSAWWSDDQERTMLWADAFTQDADAQSDELAGASSGAEAEAPSLSAAIGTLIARTLLDLVRFAEREDGSLGDLGNELGQALGGLGDDAVLMGEARRACTLALHDADRRLRGMEATGAPPGDVVLSLARSDVSTAYHALQLCGCLLTQAQQTRQPILVRRGMEPAPAAQPGPSPAILLRRIRKRGD